MNFETAFVSAGVPVTVLTTHCDIDASNYQELIGVVQKLYEEGTRDVLLDLNETAFISSSGLVALHSISLMLNGGQPLDIEDGWAALHEVGEGLTARHNHLVLLNVQPRVDKTLTVSGLKPFYAIFNDSAAALAEFKPGSAPLAAP